MGYIRLNGTFLVAQMVKNLPVMQETWVWSLGLIPGLGRFPGGERGKVFLPGESQGQRSLADCRPWGRQELDMTEHNSKAEWGGRQILFLKSNSKIDKIGKKNNFSALEIGLSYTVIWETFIIKIPQNLG